MSKKIINAVLFVFILAFLAVGVYFIVKFSSKRKNDEGCRKDDDCSSNNICVDKQCIATGNGTEGSYCSSNADCDVTNSPKLYCDTNGTKTCKSCACACGSSKPNEICDNCSLCNMQNQLCIENSCQKPQNCLDTVCPTGQYCDAETNECKSCNCPCGQKTPNPACPICSDCNSGLVCLAGTCAECRTSDECPVGMYCANDSKTCQSCDCTCGTSPPSTDCPNCTFCNNGLLCVLGSCVQCVQDSDCGNDLRYSCVNNQCESCTCLCGQDCDYSKCSFCNNPAEICTGGGFDTEQRLPSQIPTQVACVPTDDYVPPPKLIDFYEESSSCNDPLFTTTNFSSKAKSRVFYVLKFCVNYANITYSPVEQLFVIKRTFPKTFNGFNETVSWRTFSDAQLSSSGNIFEYTLDNVVDFDNSDAGVHTVVIQNYVNKDGKFFYSFSATLDINYTPI